MGAHYSLFKNPGKEGEEEKATLHGPVWSTSGSFIRKNWPKIYRMPVPSIPPM